MCLAGTVVAFWSLTQEVARWQVQVLLMLYIFVFLGKNPLFLSPTYTLHLGHLGLSDWGLVVVGLSSGWESS